MPVKLSYINALNEEVILDDDENNFAHEIVGRSGFEAPELDLDSVTYGDGSKDIVVSKMKERKVTLFFWADLDRKLDFEYQFREVKSKLIQVGNRMGGWGKLKIRQVDGTYLFLNCIYNSGFNAIVRDSNVRLKYSLTFEATDPLFYNDYESRFIIGSPDAGGLLMQNLPVKTKVKDGNGKNTQWTKDFLANNPDGIYFKDVPNKTVVAAKSTTYPHGDLTKDYSANNTSSTYMYTAALSTSNELWLDCQKVYPSIKITGAAANISIYNELTDRKIAFEPSVTLDDTKYILIETQPLHRKVVMVTKSNKKETNIMGRLTKDSSLDFFFDRGKNVIDYSNTTPAVDSQCIFTYREGWLSCQ